MKKFIMGILLCALLVSLAACGTAENSSGGHIDTSEANQTSAETTAAENLKDDLPELDFGNYAFNFLTREITTINYKITAEEETGEVLNDAIYNRNRTVEERFNFTIKETSNNDALYARKFILSGDPVFDAMHLRCTAGVQFFSEDLTHKITDLAYINMDKPWWNKTFNESIKICGEQFLGINSMNLTSYDFSHVLLFNKEIVESYNMESPYKLVKEGKWTYDKMAELMTETVKDVNGDGIMDDKDSYGFLSAAKQIMPCFWISGGVLAVAKDADGLPYLNMESEKYLSTFEKIFTMTRDNGAWYITKEDENVPASSITMFKSGQSLFMDSTFYFVNSMRDMEADFGILPYPKADESQTDYYSRVEFFDTLGIPVTNNNLERTGAIIEALSAESYKSVIPVYYETALKTKYSRDNESLEMLDLIFSTSVVDLGDTIFVDVIRDKVISPMFKENNRDITSKTEAIKTKVDKQIKDITAALEK